MMRLGILMAGGYALSPATDGRKSQIHYQADALEKLGHQVIRLNPWESYDLASLDALHIVEGGLGNIPGIFGRLTGLRKVGIAPFIDTNTPMKRYRWLTRLGLIHPRLITQQGLYRRQIANSDIVVARSSDEKRILEQGVGVPASKIRLVLNGVNTPCDVDPVGVCKEFGLKDEFAFHVSMYTQGRKNVIRLIEAIAPLKKPLVIAGTSGTEAEERAVRDVAAKNGNVRFLGRLSAFQRDSLYAACRVFCLPSIYEGTGLVALEAASYGASIVITKQGGPPDYFLNFAHYVDPWSVESIRGAITSAWTDKSSQLKDHVMCHLTWTQSAEALVAAYNAA